MTIWQLPVSICSLVNCPNPPTNGQIETMCRHTIKRISQHKDCVRVCHSLRMIFSKNTIKDVARLGIAQQYSKMEEAELHSFNVYAATFHEHYNEILNFYNYRFSNAMAESFKPKIKLFRESRIFKSFISIRVYQHQRPTEPTEKQFSNWEMDIIVDTYGYAILTLTEESTNFILKGKLYLKSSKKVFYHQIANFALPIERRTYLFFRRHRKFNHFAITFKIFN